jgi:hypothetical protein
LFTCHQFFCSVLLDYGCVDGQFNMCPRCVTIRNHDYFFQQ